MSIKIERYNTGEKFMKIITLVCVYVILVVITVSSANAKGMKDYYTEGIQADNAAQYQKAIEAWSSGLRIAEEQKHKKATGFFLGRIGTVYKNLGQYEKALGYYEQALAISREIKDIKFMSGILNSISVVYQNLGQYQKALNYYEQALAISREIKDIKLEGFALNNIGVVSDNLGQYEKALNYYEQALAIFRKIEDVKNEGGNLYNIGLVYANLGQYEKALDYYEQALAIFRKINDVKGEGANLNSIGLVYYIFCQYEKALNYYEQALAIFRKINDVKGEGTELTNIGAAYQNLSQYEKALNYYEHALDIFRKIKDFEGEGTDLNGIGVVYQNLGQYQKALNYYDQALAISREIKDIKLEGLALNNMGQALLHSGKLKKAEKNLNASIQVYESIREKVYSGTERTGFQSTLPAVYGSLAATRIALGQPGKAFESLERGRAKSFLDLLGTREAGFKKEKTGQISELENQLASLREDRVKLAAGPMGKKKRSAGVSLDNKISERDKERFDLIEQLRRNDPELGSLISVSPPGLKEIQSLLAPGTAMVEYFHNGEYKISGEEHNNLWIFIIHKRGVHFTEVDVSKADLTETLETYASLLAEETQDLKKLTAVNNQLYEWMIRPIEPIQKILTSHTLIFVPWDPMFKIPFATLAPENGRPLAASKNIVMSPSAGIYRFVSSKHATGRKKIFALGNPDTALTPLPGAEREVSKIGELFDASIIKTRGHATETLVKNSYESLGRPDVIHFASHGIFNEKMPQLSHLALTPDQKNDGNLEMHEIFDLDWKGVSLVTMSACSSGKGKLGAGDDLVGLTRGFMFAGAPAVLCSLWDVDDEATKALMVNFYKNYINGMSRPEALRRAQMSLMNTKKWSHPNYWSAFVLFGNWE